jgi:hypothetical protein
MMMSPPLGQFIHIDASTVASYFLKPAFLGTVFIIILMALAYSQVCLSENLIKVILCIFETIIIKTSHNGYKGANFDALKVF